MSVLNGAISIVLGIAGGIAVGSGVIALILVLDMIPRLAQVTQSYDKTHWYEGALIGGSLLGTVADFWHWKIHGVMLLSPIVGLFCGVFIGLLAAALTEVLNVLPVLAKRLGMRSYLFGLLLAMILGKMTGSLFDFLYTNGKAT